MTSVDSLNEICSTVTIVTAFLQNCLDFRCSHLLFYYEVLIFGEEAVVRYLQILAGEWRGAGRRRILPVTFYLEHKKIFFVSSSRLSDKSFWGS